MKLKEGSDDKAVPQERIESPIPGQSEIPETDALAVEEAATKPVENQPTKSRMSRQKNVNK